MSLIAGIGLGLAAAGAGASMFGGADTDMYQSFTPLPYNYEKGTVNPVLFRYLNQQMKGEPSAEDWQWLNAMNRTIRDQYRGASQRLGSNFAGRGVFDSGWYGGKAAELLGGRAAAESNAVAQMYQNAILRAIQAQGMAGQTLAGARAGSGTYTWKE